MAADSDGEGVTAGRRQRAASGRQDQRPWRRPPAKARRSRERRIYWSTECRTGTDCAIERGLRQGAWLMVTQAHGPRHTAHGAAHGMAHPSTAPSVRTLLPHPRDRTLSGRTSTPSYAPFLAPILWSACDARSATSPLLSRDSSCKAGTARLSPIESENLGETLAHVAVLVRREREQVGHLIARELEQVLARLMFVRRSPRPSTTAVRNPSADAIECPCLRVQHLGVLRPKPIGRDVVQRDDPRCARGPRRRAARARNPYSPSRA